MHAKFSIAAPELTSDNVVRLYPESQFLARMALADHMLSSNVTEEAGCDASAGRASTWQWDPAPEHIGSRLCQQALTIWHGLAKADKAHAPLAARFDIGAFWSLVGHLDFLEPLAEGRDFRFRVHGAEGARAIGREMTGHTLSRAPLPSKALDFIMAGKMAALRRRAPLYTRHVAMVEMRPILSTRVILPFLGDDGTVSRLLVASRTRDIGDAASSKTDGDARRA